MTNQDFKNRIIEESGKIRRKVYFSKSKLDMAPETSKGMV